MLLSIDRVLELLSEGKTTEKIAELAGCPTSDVIDIIKDAKALLLKYEKPAAKKKVVLKKGESLSKRHTSDNFLVGAELGAVPFESTLTMYVDGASTDNPGDAGIGIIINDQDDRQVGKVSAYIGKGTASYAEYTALVRALKIAVYFKSKLLKVRIDSELIVKQVKGESPVKNEELKPLYNEMLEYISKIDSFRIELISRTTNEKADYLAKKASMM